MDKKIKVAEFVTRLEYGGVESMIRAYIGHFIEKERFEIHVVTQDINAMGCIEQFQKEGFIVHVVTHKRRSLYKNVAEIYRILKEEQFDVVHSHMTLTNFYVLFLAWVLGVKKRISHSHNAFITNNPWKKIGWTFLKWADHRVANCRIACGQEAGVFLFGKKAMQSGNVYLMNNAIDLSRFRFDSDIRMRIRQKYNLENKICVGHIGRFAKQKNHRYLVEIFLEFLNMYPEAKLMLIGIGELENEIKDYVRKLGIEKSVIFVGSVTNSNEYYQAMDIFVLPSLYEGLPVVSIEAQTSGLQCLISDFVDKRCALTENVHFMSIEKEPKQWAYKMADLLGRKRDPEVISEIESAHYSIQTEAEKLQALYLETC